MNQPIRIGTRASKLALAQAHMVREALAALDPTLTFDIVAMTTAGDRELHKQLSDWGYKGLFTKELEDALLEDRVDLAVHSMKDMPSRLPVGCTWPVCCRARMCATPGSAPTTQASRHCPWGPWWAPPRRDGQRSCCISDRM